MVTRHKTRGRYVKLWAILLLLVVTLSGGVAAASAKSTDDEVLAIMRPYKVSNDKHIPLRRLQAKVSVSQPRWVALKRLIDLDSDQTTLSQMGVIQTESITASDGEVVVFMLGNLGMIQQDLEAHLGIDSVKYSRCLRRVRRDMQDVHVVSYLRTHEHVDVEDVVPLLAIDHGRYDRCLSTARLTTTACDSSSW
jgi:hypothetical protein